MRYRSRATTGCRFAARPRTESRPCAVSRPHCESEEMGMKDSFGCHGTLAVGDRSYRIARLPRLEASGYSLGRLPFALRVLLENLLRREDGDVV